MALIKQAVLQDVLSIRQHLADLKEAVKGAEEEAGKLEAVVVYQLKQGWEVEKGALRAEVGKVERRVVAWKDVVGELLGAVVVEKVMAETEPKVTEKLVIKPEVR